jgi:pimeloyl-ACP methyl ester carboxylesterase
MNRLPRRILVLVVAMCLAQAGGAEEILTVDHYIPHESTVPSIAGQHVQLYLRERVAPGTVLRGGSLAGRVVLFVHGAGTPAEVAFDVPHEDYSWMAYVAAAGYDVFSVDMTGYGRTTRPHVMNDPCNFAAEDRAQMQLPQPSCAPSSTGAGTTIASDWDDIDSAVDYIRALRGVERVTLFGWSLGGPRAGGYAARNPAKVDKLVLLAPAYSRELSERPPADADTGAVMTAQSQATFDANWRRQVGCTDQYDPAVAATVWREMLASDPVGAAWGVGLRRAPRTIVWGWNEAAVRRTRTPTLVIAGAHDAQVLPARVRDLYEDLGAERKVLLDLGCASHNAMWERVHLEMFSASLEWLRSTTVDGKTSGIVRRGYR